MMRPHIMNVLRRSLSRKPAEWERDPEIKAWVESLIEGGKVPNPITLPKKLPRKLKKVIKRQVTLKIRWGVLGRMMTAPIRRRVDYASLARRIFIVEPLPDGALPIYDKTAE